MKELKMMKWKELKRKKEKNDEVITNEEVDEKVVSKKINVQFF